MPPHAPLPRILVPTLIATLFALAGCGLEPPDATFDRYMSAAQEGDWHTVYDLLDPESRARMDSTIRALREPDADAEEANPADLFAQMVDQTPLLYRQFDAPGYDLVDLDASGDRATATIRVNQGSDRIVRFIRMRRVEGRWKVSL